MIMKKIHSNAITNEIAEACKGIIELSKKYPILDDAYFAITLEKLSENTKDVIGKINAGWLSSELKEKDDTRDLDVRALFYAVESQCVRRPSENQEKALRVMDVLNRYGMKITGSSYTNESAQIRAMLSDLNALDMEKYIRSVPDLKQLMDNVEQSQRDFDFSASKLIEDKNERENTKPASVIAKELKDIVNDELMGYLGAMALANPDKYKTYTDLLNTLVENCNMKIRERMASLKRKREQESAELN